MTRCEIDGTCDHCEALQSVIDLKAKLVNAGVLQGQDVPCFMCGEPCNNLAANPSLWAVGLGHPSDPGVVKWHHTGCVETKLYEAQRIIDTIDDGECNAGCDSYGHDDDCPVAHPIAALVTKLAKAEAENVNLDARLNQAITEKETFLKEVGNVQAKLSEANTTIKEARTKNEDLRDELVGQQAIIQRHKKLHAAALAAQEQDEGYVPASERHHKLAESLSQVERLSTELNDIRIKLDECRRTLALHRSMVLGGETESKQSKEMFKKAMGD